MIPFPVVVIDTETTGVTNSARIVEIAAVKVVHGKMQDPRSMLINPGEPIPEEAAAIHGISDDMVEGKPTFADVAEKLRKYCNGFTLCAYNAPFDKRMLCLEHERAELDDEWLEDMWLDPLVWVKHFQKYEKGKKLTDVCERMDIRLDGAHRALQDVMATARVMLKLSDQIDFTRTKDKVLAQQDALSKGQAKDRKKWIKRKAEKAKQPGPETGQQMTITPPWSVSSDTPSQ